MDFSFFAEPTDVVEYLKDKYPELHFDYNEIEAYQHHKAFTVAKITKLDLLNDIHQSLTSAYKNGTGFDEWKKSITPTLQKKGWFGDVDAVNPKTGEVKSIYVGNRRLRTIYNTNMRTAYAQARYKTQMESKAEYFRYVAVMDNRTRPTHAAHHGLILKKDDVFWDTHYPPNGWNCRCKVRVYTKKQLERKGWEVGETPLPFASKDWNYNVGKTDQNAKLLKVYRDKIKKVKDIGLRDKAKKEYARLKEKQLQQEVANRASDTLAKMFEGIDITTPGRRPPLKEPLTIGVLSSDAIRRLKDFGYEVPKDLQIITQKKLTHGMRKEKRKDERDLSKEDFIDIPRQLTNENLYYGWDDELKTWGVQFLWGNKDLDIINYAYFGYKYYKEYKKELFGLITYGKGEKDNIFDDFKGKKRIKI